MNILEDAVSSESFSSISSSSQYHGGDEESDSGVAVIFTIFLILALLLSILVSSLNFFKSVNICTLLFFTFNYFFHFSYTVAPRKFSHPCYGNTCRFSSIRSCKIYTHHITSQHVHTNIFFFFSPT